jgi:hypothetical protein
MPGLPVVQEGSARPRPDRIPCSWFAGEAQPSRAIAKRVLQMTHMACKPFNQMFDPSRSVRSLACATDKGVRPNGHRQDQQIDNDSAADGQ